MSDSASREKSLLGEPIVHVGLADPRGSYPAHLRETLLAMDRDASSVPTKVGLPAAELRNAIDQKNAIFRVAVDAIIAVALEARGYSKVTELNPNNDTSTVYASPPIEDPAEALAIGGVIRAGYNLIQDHYQEEIGNMPTLAFPQTEQ